MLFKLLVKKLYIIVYYFLHDSTNPNIFININTFENLLETGNMTDE